jgi:hypothetical protein
MSLRSPLRAVVCLLALSQLNSEELPSFSGETLSGNQVQFPAAAKGHVTVFSVGFTHGSQKQTKDWPTGIGKQFASDPCVAFYDVAVPEDAPRFVRGMIVWRAHGEVAAAGTSDLTTRMHIMQGHSEN